MKKKSRPADYKNLNVSPLDRLKRKGGKVLNSMSGLGTLQHPQGWVDECVPNLLWAVIAVHVLERQEYLGLFRVFLENAQRALVKANELFVTHNFLAVATDDEFDVLMKPVFENATLREKLGVLLAVDSLPDRSHWERNLQMDDKARAFYLLAGAVNGVADHQSEKSTDLRWFKIAYMIVCRDQVRFGEKMAHILEELKGYPEIGDQKKVRPSIRAMELGFRMIEFQTEGTGATWSADRPQLPEYDSEQFWQQMFKDAPCFVLSDYPETDFPPESVQQELEEIVTSLSNHFMTTIVTTKADPRHDGAFALALYALHLGLTAATTYMHANFAGRATLRSVMEVFVVLHYLTKEDNLTLWRQYRKYGTGQTKLAFLKYIREKNVPDFIDLDELHSIANEDRWMELEDIELGNWAGSNLRKMAEVAGIKDVYDRYYDWTSGYVHGQWASARSAVMVNCLNPLHRFHLIPATQSLPMPSVMPDICKLINRLLDDINTLYPAFKPRISAHKAMAEAEVSEEINIVEVNNNEMFS